MHEHPLMFLQVKRHIMAQLRLKAIEGSLRLLIITLKLSRLHQIGKLLFAYWIISKTTPDNTLLEILPISIRQVELCCRGDCRMLRNVVDHPVKHYLR